MNLSLATAIMKKKTIFQHYNWRNKIFTVLLSWRESEMCTETVEAEV